MIWITGLFARWGVAERLRAPMAYLAIAIAAIALLWLLKANYDARLIAEHEAEQAAIAGESRQFSAEEQAADTINNSRNEKDLHDAITAAPAGGQITPAARALGCERLRKIGRVPEACRPEGGDGSEARPD